MKPRKSFKKSNSQLTSYGRTKQNPKRSGQRGGKNKKPSSSGNGSGGNGKHRNNLEIYKASTGFLICCFIASLLWVLNAPKELVWVLLVVPALWSLPYLCHLEQSYTRVVEACLFLVTSAVLIKVLSFSLQAVIDFNKNPIIDLIENGIKIIFR